MEYLEKVDTFVKKIKQEKLARNTLCTWKYSLTKKLYSSIYSRAKEFIIFLI